MSKLLSIVLFLLAIAALSVLKLMNSAPHSAQVNITDDEIEKALAQTSDLLNKQLPMMVDSVTRLDKTFIGAGKRLIFYYVILSHSGSAFSADELRSDLYPTVKQKSCSSPVLAALMKNGVKFEHIYHYNNGNEATRVVIVSADCGT
ncbi:MAG: hypothetical protein IPP28_11545 [Xanthomonadales bacterium]|nr:hypothetical protein [Xanthomonadales bacterium]